MNRFLALNKKIIVVFLLLMGVFVLLSPEIKNNSSYYILEKPFSYIINLTESGLSLIFNGISTTYNNYINLLNVNEENQHLKDEIEKLRSEIIMLKEKAFIGERLQKLLNLGNNLNIDYTVARVIARDATNWNRSLVINKGSSDGLKPNMGVITPEGVVGRIIKLTSHYSKVLLLSDRNSSIAGLIQRTRDEGIVTGGDRETLRLKYISTDSDVQEGDIVITSGTDGVFPPGIMIGQVTYVEKEEDSLFQNVIVSPSVTFLNVREVLILKTPQSPEVERLLLEGL